MPERSRAIMCLGVLWVSAGCKDVRSKKVPPSETKPAASADTPKCSPRSSVESRSQPGPPRILEAAIDTGGSILVTFSESVRPTTSFDPSQFRLSVARAHQSTKVVTYQDLGVDLVDDGPDGSPRAVEVSALSQPAAHQIRLRTTPRLPDDACERLAALAEEYGPTELSLHFSGIGGLLVDDDGEALLSIAPDWVEAPAREVAIVEPSSQDIEATMVRCAPGAPPSAGPSAWLCPAPAPDPPPARPLRPRSAVLSPHTRTLVLSFSEPVEPVGDVDPKQFRLSVWHEGAYVESASLLSPDTSICKGSADYEGYLFEECTHDWEWADVPREFEAVKVADDGRVELRLNTKLGPKVCQELAELAQDDPQASLMLHYAGRADAALASADGRRAPDVAAPWVERTPRAISMESPSGPPSLATKVECDRS